MGERRHVAMSLPMAMARPDTQRRSRPKSKTPRSYTYNQSAPRWTVPPQTRNWLERTQS